MRIVPTVIIIVLLGLLFSGCNTAELKREQKQLIEQNAILNTEIQRLNQVKQRIENEIARTGYSDGPRYIIRLKLKQSHLTLDLFEHAKDEMNAVEVEIPVDKTFYDDVEVGTEIMDEFRTGSLLINGSFGSWDMTVIKKYIA